jgi:hypothetical protein
MFMRLRFPLEVIEYIFSVNKNNPTGKSLQGPFIPDPSDPELGDF